MQKCLAFLSIALTAGGIALAGVACDDAPSSQFVDAVQDSGSSTDAGFGFTDGPTLGDSEAPVDCSPSLPATFAPAWKPPTKAAACDQGELADYYDRCVKATGVDAGADCKAWLSAHGGCSSCLEPKDNNGPIQFYRDRFYYTLNVSGCLSLLRNEPGDGTCPAAYSASIQCQRESCDGCVIQDGAQFADFQRCQQSAKTTGCKTYEDKIGQLCDPTFNDPDGGAYACFRPSGEDERTHFLRVEGIFCGP